MDGQVMWVNAHCPVCRDPQAFWLAMVGSFALLWFAMRSLPLGTAYTIWAGIGAVGTFVVGIVFLGEHLTAGRIMAAALIVSGMVLMKMTSPD